MLNLFFFLLLFVVVESRNICVSAMTIHNQSNNAEFRTGALI